MLSNRPDFESLNSRFGVSLDVYEEIREPVESYFQDENIHLSPHPLDIAFKYRGYSVPFQFYRNENEGKFPSFLAMTGRSVIASAARLGTLSASSARSEATRQSRRAAGVAAPLCLMDKNRDSPGNPGKLFVSIDIPLSSYILSLPPCLSVWGHFGKRGTACLFCGFKARRTVFGV
ncbi:MAG: hypothetical protein LBF93_02045, partial [Zoogloeaceae bacterium]|nr:hypothetical protein [Zoogloeaceae bacterium]